MTDIAAATERNIEHIYFGVEVGLVSEGAIAKRLMQLIEDAPAANRPLIIETMKAHQLKTVRTAAEEYEYIETHKGAA